MYRRRAHVLTHIQTPHLRIHSAPPRKTRRTYTPCIFSYAIPGVNQGQRMIPGVNRAGQRVHRGVCAGQCVRGGVFCRNLQRLLVREKARTQQRLPRHVITLDLIHQIAHRRSMKAVRGR